MLLLFICILLNAKEITLQSETMNKREISFRLVRCLYHKFVTCKGSEFKESEFVDILRHVGNKPGTLYNLGRIGLKVVKLLNLLGKMLLIQVE